MPQVLDVATPTPVKVAQQVLGPQISERPPEHLTRNIRRLRR